MEQLIEVLRAEGERILLSAGDILLHQGSLGSDVYYLESGRLGVYREEGMDSYHLADIMPGEVVGEMGAATGWTRTATVKAEEDSVVIRIPEETFQELLRTRPMMTEIVSLIGERLTKADRKRITLGQSYEQARDRAQTLSTQKAQLEEILRLREEFSGMIVHDLRNPLGVIIGGIEILTDREEVSNPQAKSILSMMERAAARMQQLVDNLLDIARLEEGRMSFDPQPLDIGSLIEDVIEEEASLADLAEQTLSHRLPKSLPLVKADADLVQRVLVNLVDNALKFTPTGGDIWIEARPAEDHLRVDVLDTGPGVPREERDRIFEKFTQVKGHVGRRKGSGLGLTFCWMAIEAHEGQIWVEDGPGGVGSRFSFTLPLNEEPGQQQIS